MQAKTKGTVDTNCKVTIDVTPYTYTKTVESYRMLITTKNNSKKGVLNRHEYNNTFTTIFAT